MVANGAFLLTWRYLPPRLPRGWGLARKTLAMVAASVAAWASLAACAFGINTQALAGNTAGIIGFGAGCTAFLALVGTAACFHPLPPPPTKGTNTRTPWSVLLARGVMAFLPSMAGVFVTPYSGVAAGIVTNFPAVFGTVMVTLAAAVKQGH